MVTLFASLSAAASALRAHGNALGTTQINVNNLGAAGYARQIVHFSDDTFGPGSQSHSARNQFAEQSVWWQQSQQSFSDSYVRQLSGVPDLLGLNDVTGNQGLRAALQKLYNSFTTWAANSQSDMARTGVIHQAAAFADTISRTANYIRQTQADAQQQIQTGVADVNRLVKEIQQWNTQLKIGGGSDPEAEAQVYARIQQLSSLAPISVVTDAEDGSLTILLNGQTPLLAGGQQIELRSGPGSPAKILDVNGDDVTAYFSAGKLGGLVDYVNKFVPTLLGDGTNPGSLNEFVQKLADSVNGKLGSGAALFTYDSTDPSRIAQTLRADPALTLEKLTDAQKSDADLAAKLAQIQTGTDTGDQIGGASFAHFLDSTLQGIAQTWNTHKDNLDLRTKLLDQAENMRAQVQGVSLEEEAVNLLQYQRSFEASAKVISVIDEMLETAINLVR